MNKVMTITMITMMTIMVMVMKGAVTWRALPSLTGKANMIFKAITYLKLYKLT